eukprot:CAMPEP_0115006218 /NCGR_PEP_ID=MMETSP0216-20121206/20360_1 /TAXON_ID=223996 /ORGANISM="Protocruzia adherens, Strain Boccale" /LENGTH=42 /DNA_ID= /DNA_START= /DNA_END= /DNA_ORIENTATION=
MTRLSEEMLTKKTPEALSTDDAQINSFCGLASKLVKNGDKAI